MGNFTHSTLNFYHIWGYILTRKFIFNTIESRNAFTVHQGRYHHFVWIDYISHKNQNFLVLECMHLILQLIDICYRNVPVFHMPAICPSKRYVVSFNSTHWDRVTHICVSKIIIIASDNGLSPGRRQAIIWTNAGRLLIDPLGTNFSDILIEIHTFSFKKIHLKMSSGKNQPFCFGLNVLNASGTQLSEI